MTKKVYCCECRYLGNLYSAHQCYCPFLTTKVDTYLCEKTVHPFAKEVNKNNDCKYFEPKPEPEPTPPKKKHRWFG